MITLSKTIKPQQQGFTLVELLVSMTIGLLLMSGVLQLYVSTSRVNDDIAQTNAAIENGRLVIQLLNRDLSHGGFWNGYVPEFDDLTADTTPSDTPSAIPDPCLAFASWDAAYRTNLLGIPVQVYDAVPSSCSAIITNHVSGTDILVVRHADTNDCQPNVSGSCDANFVYFQPSMCASAPTNYTHSFTNATASLTQTQRDCSSVMPARKYVNHIYYIRDYAVTVGDGIPTLVRSEFGVSSGVPTQLAADALIEGIENLKIELGIDDESDTGASVNYGAAVSWADSSNKTSPTNRGDGIPDGAYVRCTTSSPCTAAQLSNVVSAKVYVLVRNLTESRGYTDTKAYTLGTSTLSGFNDGFQRHVYNSTVRLTNVASRRETP